MAVVVGIVLSVLLLIAGFVLCFAGYKVFRSALSLVGFLAGFSLGYGISFAWFGLQMVLALIVGLVGGLIGAVVTGLVYAVGVFLLGAAFGVLLGAGVSTAVPVEPAITVIVCGLICGILALFVQRLLVIIASAGVGAALIVTGLSAVIGRGTFLLWTHAPEVLSPLSGWMGIIWLVFFGVGLVAQFKGSSKEKEREGRKKKEGGKNRDKSRR